MAETYESLQRLIRHLSAQEAALVAAGPAACGGDQAAVQEQLESLRVRRQIVREFSAEMYPPPVGGSGEPAK